MVQAKIQKSNQIPLRNARQHLPTAAEGQECKEHHNLQSKISIKTGKRVDHVKIESENFIKQ